MVEMDGKLLFDREVIIADSQDHGLPPTTTRVIGKIP